MLLEFRSANPLGFESFIESLGRDYGVFREGKYRVAFPRSYSPYAPWFTIVSRKRDCWAFRFYPPERLLVPYSSRGFLEVVDMSLRNALSAIHNLCGPASAAPAAEGLLASCPTVWEFMSIGELDGKPRQRSTLSLWLQDGLVTVCLNERDMAMCLYAGGESLEAALLALEGKLASPSPDWRRSWLSGKRKKS